MATRASGIRSCTAVPGCMLTAIYEIRASGGVVGTKRKPPPPVHLYACETHLTAARRRVQDRETRTITAVQNTQTSMFDQP